MLIKYYNRNVDLFIIDSVKDVHVTSGLIDYSPSEPSDYRDFVFDEIENDKEYLAKTIHYSNGEGACRLIVLSTAYICNDDGKTIEKVSVLD